MKLRLIYLLLPVVSWLAFPARSNATEFIIKTPSDGGIREIVASKYQEKSNKWKTELLSTEIGRKQWESYANNKEFILTIIVSNDKKQGAGTDKFLWDDAGKFGKTANTGAKSTR